jgi:hypothetical protein
MTKVAGVLQHVDVSSLEAVLGLLINKKKDEPALPLFRLPAAAQLPSDAVCWLLLTAALHGTKECAAQLCRLAGAQQMSCQDMEGLLKACVSSFLDAEVSAIMDEEGDGELRGCDTSCMKSIIALPAAQHLSSSVILQLIRLCCEPRYSCGFRTWVCIQLLKQLPGANTLSSQDAAQQMLAAVQQGDALTVESLSYMPAAAWISREQLLSAAAAAVKEPCGTCSKAT